MTLLLAALLIGVIAGLRAMMAPAAVSWAMSLGVIHLDGGWLTYMGHRFAPWIWSLLATVELVTDQLPATPSRKVPVQFITRLLLGGLSGAVIGAAGGQLWAGAVCGVIGAVLGTFGGAALRARLAAAFGHDRPAAFIEDAIAIGGALLIVLFLL